MLLWPTPQVLEDAGEKSALEQILGKVLLPLVYISSRNHHHRAGPALLLCVNRVEPCAVANLTYTCVFEPGAASVRVSDGREPGAGSRALGCPQKRPVLDEASGCLCLCLLPCLGIGLALAAPRALALACTRDKNIQTDKPLGREGCFAPLVSCVSWQAWHGQCSVWCVGPRPRPRRISFCVCCLVSHATTRGTEVLHIVPTYV